MALAHYQAMAQDDAGNVLASASVAVHRESDGASIALFSDRAGSVGISNPFTAAVDGTVGFYVAGGAYKIDVTKDAVTRTLRYVGIGTFSEYDITQDVLNVQQRNSFATRALAIAATMSASLTSVILEGYSAAGDDGGGHYVRVSTPGVVKAWHFQSADGAYWELRANPVRPEHFGGAATPTNSTTPINNMIAYAESFGSECQLLAKQYDTDGNHQISGTVDIVGMGSTETQVFLRANANVSVFVVPYVAVTYPFDELHPFGIPSMVNFSINGNRANQSGAGGSGVDLTDGPAMLADGSNYGSGIVMEGVGIKLCKIWGVYAGLNRNAGFLHDCAIRGNTFGFGLKGGDWRVSDCELALTQNYGVYFNGFASEFNHCYIYANDLDNVYIDQSAHDVIFSSCSIDRAGLSGVHIVGNSGLRKSVVIEGTLFTTNSQTSNGGAYDISLDTTGGDVTHVVVSDSRQITTSGASPAINKPAYFIAKVGGGTVNTIDYVANNMAATEYTVGITNIATSLRSAGGSSVYMCGLEDATGLPIVSSGVGANCWFEAAGGVRVATALYIGTSGTANAWGAATGNLVISGAGYQPGGGSWTTTSDARIKNVRGDYAIGLAEINQLKPVVYTFKGNDTPEPPSAGKTVPYDNSGHHNVAVAQKEFVGLVAQEVETIFPGMVTQRDGYIDGAAVNDIRILDTTPLVFALLNAVKELKARVEALEAAP